MHFPVVPNCYYQCLVFNRFKAMAEAFATFKVDSNAKFIDAIELDRSGNRMQLPVIFNCYYWCLGIN
jgi:hypothetical protein